MVGRARNEIGPSTAQHRMNESTLLEALGSRVCSPSGALPTAAGCQGWPDHFSIIFTAATSAPAMVC